MNDWFYYALLSAIFSAAAALGQKKVLLKIEALPFSFILATFNAVLILFAIAIIGFPNIGGKESLILFGKTVIGALAFLCVMISIKNFQLSSVLPLLAFTPALVAFAAFLFLDEKFGVTKIAGMLLMLAGVYILEVKEKNLLKPLRDLFFNSNSKFIVYALLLFTVSSVLDKLLIGFYKVKATDFIVLQQLFAFLIFGAMISFDKERMNLKENFKGNFFFLVLLISVFTLAYRFLYVFSLKTGPVALALTVKRLSVLFAVVASRRLFKEGNTLRKILATLFILIGGYFIFV